jgi:hypothetical protein
MNGWRPKMSKKKIVADGEWHDGDEVVTTFGTLKQAMQECHELEREIIVHELNKYFELTRFSEEAEGAASNPEWDAGFQAALALIANLPK